MRTEIKPFTREQAELVLRDLYRAQGWNWASLSATPLASMRQNERISPKRLADTVGALMRKPRQAPRPKLFSAALRLAMCQAFRKDAEDKRARARGIAQNLKWYGLQDKS